MIEIEKTHTILEKAFAEWRKQETLKREKTSIRKFAIFLGYSQAQVGFWLNKKQKISKNALEAILPKLIELLGSEVYTELNIPKPDPYKKYILDHWDKLPPKKQKEIIKTIQKYTNTTPTT